MKATRLSSIVAVVVALGIVLMGCQSQPAAPAAPTAAPAATTKAPAAPAAPAAPTAAPAAPAAAAPQAAAAPETLKLGLAVAITGPASRFGINLERFLRMGIDGVNARGGVKVGNKVYNFEGVTADTQFTAEAGRTATNRLVLQEKTKFVLGTMQPDTAGAQAVTEANKVVLMPFAAADKSLGPDFPLTINAGMAHNIMRFVSVDDWLVKEKPNAKTIAFVGTDDTSGRANADAAEAIAKAHGLTSLGKEFFPADTKDYAPIATRVLRQKPDIMDVGNTGGLPQIFAPLAQALADQGFKGIVVSSGGNADTMRNNVPTLSKFDLFATSLLVDYSSPLVSQPERDLIAQYLKKWPQADLEIGPLPAYNTAWLLAQAMAKAGTVDDTDKIMKTLREGEWDTVFGKGKFVGVKTLGQAGVLEQPTYLTKFDSGKAVTLARVPGTMP